jgi:hypothetical protein
VQASATAVKKKYAEPSLPIFAAGAVECRLTPTRPTDTKIAIAPVTEASVDACPVTVTSAR